MFFPTSILQGKVQQAFEATETAKTYDVKVTVAGGGITGQAEAIRHGISRGLVEFNPDFRKRLRRAGFLTRDPRAKERKKFGFKRARKSPQWSKR